MAKFTQRSTPVDKCIFQRGGPCLALGEAKFRNGKPN